MERREFVQKCGIGCLGVIASGLLLEGCAGTRYISGNIEGSYLSLPEAAYLKEDNSYLKHVVVQNEALQYPIVVFRFNSNEYKALLMKCTHQGTELQVFGDRLQCPAHGSEFTSRGNVQNGPADQTLRSFQVIKELETLKIDLS
ncbi:Rieske (2Fe-2S) protein [Reichenbachiella sp.]|uniref:Rieske (2Fe-2S) protein n=1 Tax=Reichenbachiella sp. TaxID=2184521 RepID=UPI003BAEC0EC